MRWTVHLARRQPLRAGLCLAVVGASAAVGYWALGGLGAAVVIVALLGSLADFLFPVTCTLTRGGASCRMLLKGSEIGWENVRRVYLDDLGIKLSPLRRVSRLEAFRGVYLRFDGNRDQVIETVQSLRGPRCTG